MKNRSAKRYLNCIRGVETTTIDTEGTGIMTIHLIPARFGKRNLDSLVILNGCKIVTLKPAWTVMLSIFIREVNKYGEKKMTETDWPNVEAETCKRLKKIFPYYSEEKFAFNLNLMLEGLSLTAKGKVKYHESISIREYSDKMAGPIRMDLMVASMKKEGKWNCNQKCKFCSSKGKTMAEVPELPTEGWKKVIEKLWNEAYVSQLTFTGGCEPTVREDLLTIIKMAKKFITKLETNGIKLAEKSYCQELKNAYLNHVQITLYSSHPNIHNNLVGIPDAFEKTVKGIKNALEEGLDVSVSVPVVTENRKKYHDVLDFLQKLGVSCVECSDVTDDIMYSEWLRVLKNASSFCKENGMKLTFSLPGKVPESILKELGLEVPFDMNCLFNMAIAPNGNVIPCTKCIGINDSIGNIFGNKWIEDIWMNPKTRRIQKENFR